MQVHRNTESLPLIRNAVVTIGTFDGVHTGHQKIIGQLKDEAKLVGGETVLITFHPHPRKIVSSQKQSIQLINTLDEKIELLAKQGLDHLVIVLIGRFHPHTVIIGYDHRFGHDRKGDYRLLEQYAERLQFRLKEIPEHIIDSITVSSTRIREAIRSGNIRAARELLGYDFFFQGTVIAGNKLGRQLGYPTANIEVNEEEKLIPGDGIYAVEAEPEVGGLGSEVKEGVKLKGMMSIGIRPTIGDNKHMIEVNLFDFDQDIYDQTLRVYVKAWMRPELKFDSLDELVGQLHKDKENALELLSA
jgi:riboflavin kinase/FMN adenylyltransferase